MPTKHTDFYPYSGNGFQLSVPGKWNPTKEVEYPGQQVRYEDNYDTVSSLYVSKIPSSKSNVKDFGDPIKFPESALYAIMTSPFSEAPGVTRRFVHARAGIERKAIDATSKRIA